MKYLNTALLITVTLFMVSCPGNERFTFGLGGRVAIVGNFLAERMQHDGWPELLLQASIPITICFSEIRVIGFPNLAPKNIVVPDRRKALYVTWLPGYYSKDT